MAKKAGEAMQQEQQVDKHRNSTRPSFAGRRFSTGGLMIARVVWVAFTLGIFVLFASSPASEYAHLQVPCHNPNCDVGQITVGNVVALHRLGISISLYALYPLISGLVIGGVLFLVSFVIFWRRSDHWFPFFVSLWLLVCAQSGLVGPDSSLFSPQVMSVILNGLAIVVFTALGVFCVTFPNGRFAPRWSWLIPLFWTLQLIAFLAPGPFNITNWPGPLFPLDLLIVYGGTLALQIYRYVRLYDAVERQQTKWLVYGLVITLLYLLCSIALSAVFPPDSPTLLLLLPVPLILILCLGLAVGAAIFHYRLWDIDLIINRTLVYGTLSTCVIGMYVLIVGYFGALFQTPNNPVISLIATAIVAIVFQPLRGLLQRAVNRLMYGERHAPYQVLARLDQQLALAMPPEDMLPALVKTIATTLRLPYAAVALVQSNAHPLSEERLVAIWGQPNSQATTDRLPIVFQGETVGQLVLAPRSGEAQLTRADRRLLEDLARHAGVIVHAVHLTADLRHSRERLVMAREEERRRLRRDLHDGLGPQLSSQTFTLSAIKKLLRQDPDTAEQLLTDATTHAQEAIADIRRLVYALRPPALDDLGLLAALQEQMTQYHASGIVLTLDAPEALPPLPAATEMACYRIVQEALTNVVRHAHATAATVSLRVQQENLEVEVRDNGLGLPPGVRSGVGLSSMHERAGELGGTCLVESMATGGTCVRARLPLLVGQHNENETAPHEEGVA